MEELTEAQTAVLSSDELANSRIGIAGDTFTLLDVVGNGKKGVVWEAINDVGAKRAVKFAIESDYSKKSPMAERSRASVLEPYPFFARLERVDRIAVLGVGVVALVSEWVDGRTLEHIVKYEVEAVSADFIRSFVTTICDALGALRAHGLCHDDLNFGNVMVVKPLPGLREPEQTFKLVDLGSLKLSEDHDATRKRDFDDFRWLGLHLAALHNAARKRYDLSPRERHFLKQLPPIVTSLLEADPVQRIVDPLKIPGLVEAAWQRTGQLQAKPIGSPFEYISADQIADDGVLLELFADSLPWLDSVNSPTPQIVTGPRGCGKSTVFRWLALRTHLSPRQGEETARRHPSISGFYVSAGVELQSRLGWIRDDDTAMRNALGIIHLFNLIVVREVVKTLAMAAEQSGGRPGLALSADDASAIREEIETAILFRKVDLYAGVPVLRQVSRELNRSIFDAHQRLICDDVAPEGVSSAASLPAFTSLLHQRIGHFESHPIVFLVDDFSTHRVPAPVQEVLHDIIWLRAGSHTFKVSAEKNGVHRSTRGGRTAEIAREFREVDCGAIMLQESSPASIHEFAVQLLDTRLQACGYVSDASSLLGVSSWDTKDGRDTVAQYLWEVADGKLGGRAKGAYFGTSCIADLCSGDVAALLLVYESIFRKAKVTRNTTKAIRRGTQHDAIVSVSRQLVTQLRDYYGVGPEMHDFTDSFGTLIGHVLKGAKRNKDGDPVQMPRIEVDGFAEALAAVEADDRANRIYDELLRRAVLINLDPGNARHDDQTSLRLHLRKIFLPAFGAALAKNRALALSSQDLVFALCEPKEAFASFEKRVMRPRDQSLFDVGNGVA